MSVSLLMLPVVVEAQLCTYLRSMLRHPADANSQAAAVHSAVVNGWNEMDDMPLSDTLALAKTLDRIRWQVGLIYPQDKGP